MSQRALKIDCMNNVSRECFLQRFLHVNPVQHHHIAEERTPAGRHQSSTAELTLALSGFIEHAHINTYVISDHHSSMSVNLNIKFASQDCLSSIKHRQDLSSAPIRASFFFSWRRWDRGACSLEGYTYQSLSVTCLFFIDTPFWLYSGGEQLSSP